MGRVEVRNIEDYVVAKIDALAKKNKMSREAYLRNHLKVLALSEELSAIDNKYENLIHFMADVIEHNTKSLEELQLKIDYMEREKR